MTDRPDPDPPGMAGPAPSRATCAGRRGSFDEVPLGRLLRDFPRHYPGLVAGAALRQGADFLADVECEVAR